MNMMRDGRTSEIVCVYVMGTLVIVTLLFCTAAIGVRTTVWLERALGWSFPVSASTMDYVDATRAVMLDMRQACVEDAPQAAMDEILARRDALRAESRWKILRALLFGTNEFTHSVNWQCGYRGTKDAYVIVHYTYHYKNS